MVEGGEGPPPTRGGDPGRQRRFTHREILEEK
nr:MAG TPA: hypothetical protein [Caudoviricetes sp.]